MKLKLFFLIPFFLLAFTLTSFNENNSAQNDGKFVVVLDAGHGGHDPGNLGNGYLEKNIALKIVLRVGAILEKNPNIKVIYTRDDDTFVDLYVRGEIANKANADLFVSVHCDSHTSNAHGAGTFVLGLHANKQNFEIAKKENSVIYLEDNYESRYADYDINSPESVIGLTIMQEEFLDHSIALAKEMQENFSGKLKRNNRKVKQAGFIVLHQTFMPSVLVETGFLTNKEEGSYLNSKKGQLEMGTAIANAILEYKKNTGYNIAQNTKEISTDTTSEDIKEEIPVVEKPRKKEPEKTVVVKETVPEPKKVVVEKEKTPEDKLEEKETNSTPAKSEVVETKKEEPKKVVDKVVVEKKEVPPTINKDKAKVLFKVQIMASTKDIPLESKNFNGLGRLSREPYQKFYRYMYGVTNLYKEAETLKAMADIKGYTTSYIVAYKDGKRISVKEALKYVSE